MAMIRGLVTIVRAQWEHVLGCLLAVFGLVLMLVGIRQVADAKSLVDQLSFLMSTGVFGLGLVAVGVGVFLSGDLHDEWRRLDRIEAAMGARVVQTPADPLGAQRPLSECHSLTAGEVR
jgi:uncharacterized membrane protein